MKAPAFGLALAGIAAAGPLRAAGAEHWLSPDVLVADAGTDVYVSDLVGARFVRLGERPHEPALEARFALLSDDGPPIDLRARTRPLALPVAATFLGPGAHLFVLDRAPVEVSLPAAAFEDHLRAVGLAAVVAARAARAESALPGVAREAWFEKAFVRIGPSTDPAAGARFVGQTLEIVPEHDPTDPTVSTIPVRVALHGVPLPDQALVAHRRAAGGRTTLRLVTDESGRVALPLTDGAYLLVAGHAARCVGCGDVQWTASFASFSFGRGRGTVRTPQLSAPEAPGTAPRQRRAVTAAALATLGLAIAALCAIRERRTLGAPS